MKKAKGVAKVTRRRRGKSEKTREKFILSVQNSAGQTKPPVSAITSCPTCGTCPTCGAAKPVEVVRYVARPLPYPVYTWPYPLTGYPIYPTWPVITCGSTSPSSARARTPSSIRRNR